MEFINQENLLNQENFSLILRSYHNQIHSDIYRLKILKLEYQCDKIDCFFFSTFVNVF